MKEGLSGGVVFTGKVAQPAIQFPVTSPVTAKWDPNGFLTIMPFHIKPAKALARPPSAPAGWVSGADPEPRVCLSGEK